MDAPSSPDSIATAPGRAPRLLALMTSAIGVVVLVALTLIGLLIAVSTLIGYLYARPQFGGLASHNPLAFQAAIAMLFFATGILLARPDCSLPRAITPNSAGGAMGRRLLPIALIVPVFIDLLIAFVHEAGFLDANFAAAIKTVLIGASLCVFTLRAASGHDRIDLAQKGYPQAPLDASEWRVDFPADAMPQIVWTARPNGAFHYLNRLWYQDSGMRPEESLGWGWASALHPDDKIRCIERWRQAVESGEPYEIEFRLKCAGSDTYRWYLGRTAAVRGDRGEVRLWIGTYTDIDDRKRAEDHLREIGEDLQRRARDRTAEVAAANADLQRQVSERRKIEQELRHGELRYKSLVNVLTAIVWNTPGSGEFETDQPAWSRFTGQSFEQLKGWGWLDAVHPDDRELTARIWSAAVANRTIYEIEHRIRGHDGAYRHMSVRAVPIMSDEGTLREWVGVHTDIDEQMQVKEMLRLGKESAEATTRAKSEFLANMSHEIRTPMNGILGMTELALQTDLTAQQREYLEIAKSAADSLLVVINDILDFSKIEAGKFSLDPMPFALRDCVEGTLKTLALRAHEKGLELSGRIAPGIPDGLVGDAGRLQQIILNLVGNALKFTEHGEVGISIELVSQESQSEELTLHFAVRDTGIGIPSDKLQLILEPFTQANGSTTRKYGGTGLGLSISRNLVEMMGGRLWVESQVATGTTFHFTVKLCLLTGPSPCVADVDPERLRDLPILVVDDNRTNRRILDEVLTSCGATPTSVEDGRAALAAMHAAKAAGHPFPLVLLDVMMPDMDGWAVAAEIAAEPSLAETRVVLLTSADSSEVRTQGQSPKIAARLTKPIRQSELFNVLIHVLCSEQPASIATTFQRTVEPRFSTTIPSLTNRRLKILVADDQIVNQKVVKNMLEKQRHVVTVVGTGRQAIEAQARAFFDLVLMDVQMPELDGFEAVAAIRLQERQTGGRHLPIVALTAHAMKGDKERCLTAGFDSYLSKPIRSERLYATIGELLEAMAVSTDSSRLAGAAPHAIATFDRATALELSGGDEAFFSEILEMFLDDYPRLLDEMRKAIANHDLTALHQALHTLTGIAANVAAQGVVSAARRIEALIESGPDFDAAIHLASLETALGDFARLFGRPRSPMIGSQSKFAGVVSPSVGPTGRPARPQGN